MRVARDPAELDIRPRAVAIGSFDGVHRGHRAVIDTVRATGLEPTVITFDPHPRIALGNRVELLTTLERRVELLGEAGVNDVLVASFTPELQQLTPDEFADRYLRATGVETVVAGADFRFGVRRSGDLALLERLGYEVLVVPELAGVSSTAIRAASRRRRRTRCGRHARPPVRARRRRGRGRPARWDARLPDGEPAPRAGSRVPGVRDLRGVGLGHRAAISIGTNPHYGGSERRIEPYLLDFDGDLYGKRLVVELWERLRDEAVFESEAALVEQIASDVEATKLARRP